MLSAVSVRKMHEVFRAPKIALALLQGLCLVLFFWFLFQSLRTRRQEELLKCLQCAGIGACAFLPRFFKLENRPVSLLFALFLFCGSVLGSLADWYAVIPIYDILMHALSGVLCVVGLHSYLQARDISATKASFFLLSFLLVSAVAALWEMYEFSVFTVFQNPSASLYYFAHELFGEKYLQGIGWFARYTAQAPQAPLYERFDTFSDVFCAGAGGLLTSVCYLKHFPGSK